MIEQIDPSDSSVMATFESVQDAAAAVNGSKGGVSAVLAGERKTHKGYGWRRKGAEARAKLPTDCPELATLLAEHATTGEPGEPQAGEQVELTDLQRRFPGQMDLVARHLYSRGHRFHWVSGKGNLVSGLYWRAGSQCSQVNGDK